MFAFLAFGNKKSIFRVKPKQCIGVELSTIFRQLKCSFLEGGGESLSCGAILRALTNQSGNAAYLFFRDLSWAL
jgi:hypothetical protein